MAGRLALAALLAVVAVACGGSDDGGATSGSTTEATGTTAAEDDDGTSGGIEVLDADDPDFYSVPVPLPQGEHGDLIRTQPVDGAPEGATWQRIMYLSETLAGEPTVVTGVISLPDGEPPEGGWPLFSHAHGSTGLADPCAPSVSLDGDGIHSIEIALLGGYVADHGIAIVSTDYEGLGGPGRHPFLVGESEGRSVLDAILAARQLPDVAFEERVGIIGYSQGGHASAWANQIAPEYTPELDVIGTLAGAPATEVVDMVGSDEGAGLMMVAALSATGGPYDPPSILTDAGLRALDEIDTVCQEGYRVEGPYLTGDVLTTEPWASGIAAQVPGSAPGASPVLIVHSQEDVQVPIEFSEAFQDRLCAAGGVVERRVLDEGDHVVAAVPAYEQGMDWITDLANGGEPDSTCP